jgi:TetR/AcrR family acrAB operon transcriptional repressor
VRRTKADAEKTREDIFRAGISVFARNGYAATTLDDVARAAGCTRGAIYWHFRNKEAFYRETLQRLNRYYDELVDAALNVNGSPLDVVVQATTEVIRKFARDREFRDMQELAMRTAISGGIPRNETDDRPIQRDGAEAIPLLEEAIRRNGLYNRWSAEAAFFSLTSFLSGVFLQIIEHNLILTDEHIEEMVGFVRRGMAPLDGDRPQKETIHATHHARP